MTRQMPGQFARATLGLFAIAASAAGAHAAPNLVSVSGGAWPSPDELPELRPLAIDGPISIDPTADVTKRYLMLFEFDEPILGAKGASATNAIVEDLYVLDGQPYVFVELREFQDRTHLTVEIDKVASASGVFQNVQGAVGLLRGDYNGDGVADAGDLVPFLDSPDGPDTPTALGPNAGDNAIDPALLLDLAAARRTLPNLPPIVGEGVLMHAAPGELSLPKSMTVRDDRLDNESLEFIATSTNPDLVPFENIQVVGEGSSRVVFFRAAPGASGACTIVVSVLDETSVSEALFPVIIKPDEPADARFSMSHHVGRAPHTTAFDASATSDILDNVVGFVWDFGDGQTAVGERVEHTFQQAGSFDVMLTAIDANGQQATETHRVTVSNGSQADGGPVTELEARRFLWQAAFGPTDADVADVISLGYEGWIDQQIASMPTLMSYADLEYADNQGYHGTNPGWIFDDYAIQAPDQLRQRMAWALIQIIVMHEGQDGSNNETTTHYYSQYIDQGLGNYRDLLEYVTFSYPMATYLTYRYSSKANPNNGSVPDENYAREIKQLFSIGLWALDDDGQRSLDVFGDEYPIYGNDSIKEFARVFTGLRRDDEDINPLRGEPYDHDFGDKQLLDYPGVLLPDGVLPGSAMTEENIFADVQAAIDNVFHHPSCAPFLARRLIQRMTSSNPTPAYVQRVAEAFEGLGPYGTGVRGDLAATAKAILLDPEVRDPAYRSSPYTGKVIEPLIIHYALFRILGVVDRPSEVFPFRYSANYNRPFSRMRQAFMKSETVFNFYQPADVPIGSTLERASLTAPELRIHDDLTAIEAPNLWMQEVISETDDGERSPLYDAWLAAANGDDAVLVDEAIADMLHTPLDPQVRAIIVQAVSQVNGDYDKTRAVATLLACSPDFTVLK
ncbi:MAG: DUF1800 family protein [Planctomycetota bacterium]